MAGSKEAAVLFAVPIYCDFGSYSMIAIGVAKILGFTLMENFKAPYFARSAGIPLLIVLTPYPGVTAGEQAVFNTAADVAAEYGIPFVSYNLDFQTLGLVPSGDYFDGHHMNIWGARKFTRLLGAYLADHYDLPDHRGDPAYQSWEDNARYIAAYDRDGKLAQGSSAPKIRERKDRGVGDSRGHPLP